MRVLLAEDSATNRLVAQKILEAQGFQVDLATNGHEALRAASAIVYDLILMDVSMPELDGLSATREIRKLPDQYGRPPILAMTAHALTGDREKCLDAGMDDYISKPVTHEKLLEVIGRWVKVEPALRNSGSGIARDAASLDPAVLDALVNDVSASLLRGLIDSFIADVRARMRLIDMAASAGDLPALLEQARAVAGAAGIFGARQLEHWAHAVEHVCRTNNLAMGRALAGSVNRLAEEAMAALTARFGSGRPG